MSKTCESCSTVFEPQRTSARFCSDKCRKRFARQTGNLALMRPNMDSTAPIASPTVTATTLLGQIQKTLSESGVIDTPNGQLALRLATRIENQGNDSGSSVAALSKELRLVMAEAMNRVVEAENPIDELRRRRESRHRA